MGELDDQLKDVWELVAELSSLSQRLQEAAIKAEEALRKAKETT